MAVDELVERRWKHLVLCLPRPGDDVRERVPEAEAGIRPASAKLGFRSANGACAIV